jgi:hypothetical protein
VNYVSLIGEERNEVGTKGVEEGNRIPESQVTLVSACHAFGEEIGEDFPDFERRRPLKLA